MSLIFFLAMIMMYEANYQNIQMDFFIAWALFAIADAIWIGRCKK